MFNWKIKINDEIIKEMNNIFDNMLLNNKILKKENYLIIKELEEIKNNNEKEFVEKYLNFINNILKATNIKDLKEKLLNKIYKSEYTAAIWLKNIHEFLTWNLKRIYVNILYISSKRKKKLDKKFNKSIVTTKNNELNNNDSWLWFTEWLLIWWWLNELFDDDYKYINESS